MTGHAQNAEHFRKLERMYDRAPINRFFQPRLSVSRGAAEVTLEVRQDFFHAAGAAHGAMYFKALDDAAYFAAGSLSTEVFVLTISFTTYIERPVREGQIRCLGQVVMAAKNLFIAESRIEDAKGQEIARGSGHFIRSNIPLTPEIGYA